MTVYVLLVLQPIFTQMYTSTERIPEELHLVLLPWIVCTVQGVQMEILFLQTNITKRYNSTEYAIHRNKPKDTYK